MKIDNPWLETHDWMLRSSNKGISHEGFKWKRKGAWTKPEKWNPAPVCSDGLFGETPEAYGFGFKYGIIELCETRGKQVKLTSKVKVAEARIVARGKNIPAEAFILCGYKIAKDGQTISPEDGERWLVLAGATVNVVSQTGGRCTAVDGGIINAKGQLGGDCCAVDDGIVNATGQVDGECYAWGGTVNSKGQSGGACWAAKGGVLNAVGQIYGFCWAGHGGIVNSVGQKGGDCWAREGVINSSDQVGGKCHAWKSGKVNVISQKSK